MKQFDSDGLNELFNLEIEPPEGESDDLDNIDEDASELSETEYVDTELKRLGATANQILSTAQMMLHATPDSETVSAAANLISSITHLISEYNKAVLIDKKHRLNTDLEKMKIKARKELAELRNQHKIASLGSGNTFIQNNTKMVAFSQEDIVKQLSKLDTEFLIEPPSDDEN